MTTQDINDGKQIKELNQEADLPKEYRIALGGLISLIAIILLLFPVRRYYIGDETFPEKWWVNDELAQMGYGDDVIMVFNFFPMLLTFTLLAVFAPPKYNKFSLSLSLNFTSFFLYAIFLAEISRVYGLSQGYLTHENTIFFYIVALLFIILVSLLIYGVVRYHSNYKIFALAFPIQYAFLLVVGILLSPIVIPSSLQLAFIGWHYYDLGDILPLHIIATFGAFIYILWYYFTRDQVKNNLGMNYVIYYIIRLPFPFLLPLLLWAYYPSG